MEQTNVKKISRQELHRRAYDLALELFRLVSCDAEAVEFDLSVEIRKAAQDTVRHLSPDLDAEDALDVASGSAARLEYTLLLAKDLGLFPHVDLEDFRKRAAEIGAAARKLKSRR